MNSIYLYKKKTTIIVTVCLHLMLTLLINEAAAQDTTQYISVAAGAEYDKPASFQKKWGKNRREEWTTPVNVPYLYLKDAYGGLKPYKGGGGGNETKSLRLRSDKGKELVLRSINKSRDEVVPEFAKGTFIQEIIQDGVSMSHPFGAFALAGMQDAAGINHTFPILVYLPPQEALDSFNADYANDLYMFEERPDEDWREADHLGNSEKYTSTSKVIEKLLKSSHHRADQFAFAKARLFDMLVGDWDRHADNYRWAKFDDSLGYNIYEPVPRDRDQVFYTHNGMLVDRMIDLGGFDFMLHFDHAVGDVTKVPRQQIDMDKFFTNKLSKEDWLTAARDLQQVLTDSVISKSLQRMPAEIYAISGKELTEKLISRRTQIQDYAIKYYLFLAKAVTITASEKPELITISSTKPNTTTVQIKVIDKDTREPEDLVVYERTFSVAETKLINIYGIGDNDIYKLEKTDGAIAMHIYAGTAVDSFYVTAAKNIIVHDSGQVYVTGANSALRLARKQKINQFSFRSTAKKDAISKELYFYYSKEDLFKKAIGLNLKATLPKAIGKWNYEASAFYSPIRWTNYFGTGNETKLLTEDRPFYRYKSTDWGGAVALVRKWKDNKIDISAGYLGTSIYEYGAGFLPLNQDKDTAFSNFHYANLGVNYEYKKINNKIVPTSGLIFRAGAAYWHRFEQEANFQRYSLHSESYLPLTSKFSLAVKGGVITIGGIKGSTIKGQLIQSAVVGGPETIRGFRSQRFWGRTAFYNQNELRYITDWRNRLFNAKIGLLAFVDAGRVWVPGEDSDKTHRSYGAGLLFAPFYKLQAVLTYGVSAETKLVQFTLRTPL